MNARAETSEAPDGLPQMAAPLSPGLDAVQRLDGSTSRHVVLILLTALNAFNHLDRQVMSILLEAVRSTFGLGDIELGLLSGPAFAVLYTMLGIPAAIWAMRHDRINLVAVSAVVWGGMTAFCGLAASFSLLLLGRIGVGVGEAGCIPSAQAIISDLYPKTRRAAAMSILYAGSSAGIFMAFLIGGLIGQWSGWRAAFVIAGVPTMALGVILKLTVPEPARSPDATASLIEARGFQGPLSSAAETAWLMWRDRALRHMCFAATLTSTAGYATLAWLPSFLMRAHGLHIAQAGLYLAVVIGIGGAAGNWFGGVMSDRLGARDIRWSLWFPALVYVAVKPLLVGVYLFTGTPLVLALFVLPGMVGAICFGPSVAVLHDRVPSALRPMASAIFLILLNLVGLGLGPLLVGALSEGVFAAAGAHRLGDALLVMQILSVWGIVHYYFAGQILASAPSD